MGLEDNVTQRTAGEVIRVLALICAILAGVTLPGCEGGREENYALTNGYRFVRSNSTTAAIFVPEDMIYSTGGYYGPGVTIYSVEGSKVYGRIDPAPNASIPQRTEQGYFVLDTAVRTFTSGLTELEYTKAGGHTR